MIKHEQVEKDPEHNFEGDQIFKDKNKIFALTDNNKVRKHVSLMVQTRLIKCIRVLIFECIKCYTYPPRLSSHKIFLYKLKK